jgi:hypothetical protein
MSASPAVRWPTYHVGTSWCPRRWLRRSRLAVVGVVLGPDVLGIDPDKARSLPERASRIGAAGHSIRSFPRPGLSPRSPARGFSRKPLAFPCSVRRGLPCRRARCPSKINFQVGPSSAFEYPLPWLPRTPAGWFWACQAEFALGSRSCWLAAATQVDDSVTCRSRPTRPRSAGSHGRAGIGVRSGLVRIAKHIRPSGEDTATAHPAAAAPPLAW